MHARVLRLAPLMTAQPEGGAGERILVVEDDSEYRALLQLRLQTEGHGVVAVGTAEQALQLLAEVRPTLLVTDIVLPGMSGLELCREVRALPDWVQLPILILSGVEESSAIGEVVGLGLIWYLSKGAGWPDFLKTVRNLLSRAYAVPESRLA